MEKSGNSSQKCLPTPPVDFGIDIGDGCTFRETTAEEWQELEQFWGDPRHRLQDFDSQTQQLSSSLERHLLFDECIRKPEDELENKLPRDDSSFLDDSDSVIRGEDINDVPTQYAISGFKPDELVVIGTYIDKLVIPGFKYKVRKNLTEKYLFEGKAVRLDQIGLGYGKRLTFEGPTLNNNPNYFWSDSWAVGFGFTLSTIDVGDTFAVFDPVRHHYCGRVVVRGVAGPQVVKSVVYGQKGRVEKTVAVQFTCDLVYGDVTTNQTLVVQDTLALGTVLVVKKDRSAAAQVEAVHLDDFVIEGCQLKPEE